VLWLIVAEAAKAAAAPEPSTPATERLVSQVFFMVFSVSVAVR
jgi:hypothetical protein